MPHIARIDHLTNAGKWRKSAIDGRARRHTSYGVSQRIRKRIEVAFGWMNTMARHCKTRFRGAEGVGFVFTFAGRSL
jgi:hypothetical protein